jgi:drug/metabolite transporter (DMT)-like permease
MWLLLAILNPVSESFRSLFIKKGSKQVDPLLISWANNILPVLILPPFLIFVDLRFSSQFWIGFAGSGTIQVINTVLYMRAISKADISTVMPMLSFTPLFLLITAPIIVGEFPNTIGLVGILLIVIGSYLLNFDYKKISLLEPFRAIFKNQGTRLMFIVSFLWGISGAFDKLAVSNSSVIQYVTFLNLLVFICTTILVIAQKKFDLSSIKTAKFNLLAISGFTTVSYLFHYGAMALTLAAYVVAIKRITGVFSVIIGFYFLNEPNIRQRLFASIVMFIGVLLIVFSQ